jgi:hypothetical protein
MNQEQNVMQDSQATFPVNVDVSAAMRRVMDIMDNVAPEDRQRLLQGLVSVYNLSPLVSSADAGSGHKREGIPFSDEKIVSPKEFLFQKRPQSDVERVATLAYYLTHYRDTPHFKTLDISKLNTEAAQAKFSNTAYAVDNATKQGYLVPAVKGNKQINAPGELFVEALPDREAAKQAMQTARPKKRSKRVLQSKGKSLNNGVEVDQEA